MPCDTITPTSAATPPQPSTKSRCGPVQTVSNNTSALTLGDLERAAVRCRDCRLDLEPGLTLRAAFACPRFGKPRWQHSGPCDSFVPKAVLP